MVVNDLSVRNGVISVDMFTHGPNDGMCCPTVPIIFRFKLEGNRLTQVGDTPWLLQLTNGAKCQLSSETTLEFEGKRVNYQCDNGASLLGDVLAGVPWTATQGFVTKVDEGLVISDTRAVDLAIIWQPVDPRRIITEVGLAPDQVTVDPGTMAASVSGHVRPGLDYNPNAIPDLNGDPPHIRLTFDDQVLPNWTAIYPELPQILVFPVELYKTMYRRIGLYEFEKEIDNLQSVIEEKPETLDVSIPLMPAIPAAQTFAAQVKYLAFEGGQGIRFITHYAQDAAPITNDRIFYTFQGVTDDGKYLVSVYHPIATVLLPDDYQAANVDANYDVFVQNFDSYLQHTVLAMDESKPADFSPSLDDLDAMVQSIQVGK